jgi:hypothetical protein
MQGKMSERNEILPPCSGSCVFLRFSFPTK